LNFERFSSLFWEWLLEKELQLFTFCLVVGSTSFPLTHQEKNQLGSNIKKKGGIIEIVRNDL